MRYTRAIPEVRDEIVIFWGVKNVVDFGGNFSVNCP